MFSFWPAAVGLKKQRNRSQAVAMRIGQFGAEFEQERKTVSIQGFTGTHDESGYDAGSHRVQTARGFELALKTRPVKSMLQIVRTHFAQHCDDPILPDIRSVRHRRAPVAVGHATRAFV